MSKEKAKITQENKKEMNQEELTVLYLQKQLAAMDSYQAMIAAGKDGGKELEDYKKFREIWMKNKEDVVSVEKQLSPEVVSYFSENVNFSRKDLENALEKLGGVYPPTDAETEPSESAVSEPEIEKEIESVEPVAPKNEPKPKIEEEKIEQPQKQKEKIQKVPPDAWMGIGDVWAGGRIPEKINEDRIRQYIDFVRKASGENSLKYQYALSLLENLKERPARQAAEDHRDEVQKLEEENERLQRELQRAKQEKGGIFSEPRDKEISIREREIEGIKGELKKEKKGLGNRFKENVSGFFKKLKKEEENREKPKEEKDELQKLEAEKWEKIGQATVSEQAQIEKEYNKKIRELKGSLVSGWFSERAKGFAGGFGWWEGHQAEKFRLGTKETGKEAKAQAKLLEQEGLPDEEDVSVSEKKKEYNQKIEDRIIALALQNLENSLKNKSWIEQYKAANGGAVVTPEKIQLIEQRMREEIGKLRKGQTKKDLVDFVKLSRGALDKNWWHRYIYAGLGPVLVLTLKWVAGGKTGVAIKKLVALKAGR